MCKVKLTSVVKSNDLVKTIHFGEEKFSCKRRKGRTAKDGFA